MPAADKKQPAKQNPPSTLTVSEVKRIKALHVEEDRNLFVNGNKIRVVYFGRAYEHATEDAAQIENGERKLWLDWSEEDKEFCIHGESRENYNNLTLPLQKVITMVHNKQELLFRFGLVGTTYPVYVKLKDAEVFEKFRDFRKQTLAAGVQRRKAGTERMLEGYNKQRAYSKFKQRKA